MASHTTRGTRALDKLGVKLAPLFDADDLEMAKQTLMDGLSASRRVRAGRNPAGGYLYEDQPDYPTRVVCAVKVIEWGIGKPVSTSLMITSNADAPENDPEAFFRSAREDPETQKLIRQTLERMIPKKVIEIEASPELTKLPDSPPESQSGGSTR